MKALSYRHGLLLVPAMILLGASTGVPQEASFTGFRLEPVASGLTAPHYLTTPPGEARRFVLDLPGQIHILGEADSLVAEPFLDLGDRIVPLNEGYDERGLLGLAFHPEYDRNGLFYVYYSAPLREGGPAGWDHTSHLSEFRVSANADRADAASERVILRIDQPQLNHNGGRILFGPDGYLYVGLGDGGAAADQGMGHPPLGNGQDVTTMLGSVLRIDVNQQPYGIPADNPLVGKELPAGVNFAGTEPRTEIWAWGIRNAWGMSCDPETGELYVADVGQILWEEVNVLKQPGNYGWRLQEGTHGFDPQDMDKIIENPPQSGPLGEPLIGPVIEYANKSGQKTGRGICVIGGHVYRGRAIPQLRGQYVFGDWTRRPGAAAGVIFVATRPTRDEALAGRDLWSISSAVNHDQYILGFGEDADGELYVLASSERGPTGNSGKVFRILPDR